MRRLLIVIILLAWTAPPMIGAQRTNHRFEPGEGLANLRNDRAAGASYQRDSQVSVEAILDRYVAALGGMEAINSLTSVEETSSFEAPEAGLKGSTEAYSKLPNKVFQKVRIEGVGVFLRVSDGKKEWSGDPVSGVVDITGLQIRRPLSLSDLRRDIKHREIFKALTVIGKEKVGNNDAYVIKAVPSVGLPETFYFDTTTGLLVRKDIVAISLMGETPTQTFFEDYREVGGVRIPFTVRQVTPALTCVTTLRDIKVNVAIDDARFAKPSLN